MNHFTEDWKDADPDIPELLEATKRLGEMKGQPTRDGQIGAILIPDAPAFDKVLRDHRFFGFPLEVTASVSIDGKPFFMSEKKRELVTFPRYRVYFYNSTNRTATA